MGTLNLTNMALCTLRYWQRTDAAAFIFTTTNCISLHVTHSDRIIKSEAVSGNAAIAVINGLHSIEFYRYGAKETSREW
jgi:hypothetical protein